jgi:pimeloyl-ACP methyl ester carboxylesterase
MIDRNAVKLDPRESHYWIPSHHAGLLLFLRHLAPEDGGRGDRIVLYVHGATFPSALSIAHRLDLDCDPQSRTRWPAAVQVPSGALQDILDAWAGELGYDPALIRAPVSIVRGEWDSLVTDGDARWLFDALHAVVVKWDVKISKGTHLMHLEQSRFALYRAAECFLLGRDLPAPIADVRTGKR